MKRIFAMAIAILVLADADRPGPGFPFPAAEYTAFCPPAEYMNCRILYQTEESLLLTQEENGEETGDLILLSPSGIDMAGEQGESMQASQLEAGMTVQIGYDGSILESYPCQFERGYHIAGYWNG